MLPAVMPDLDAIHYKLKEERKQERSSSRKDVGCAPGASLRRPDLGRHQLFMFGRFR